MEPEPVSSPTYRLCQGVAFRVIDGEGVAVLPVEKKLIGINGTAARIIELLDGERSVADVAQILCDEFDASLGQVSEEAKALLDDLSRRGVLEVVVP
jgi:hypothetical protein